jgi:serine/threonine protein kinase
MAADGARVRLGAGAYGTVYAATDAEGRRVAIKRQRIDAEGVPAEVLREHAALAFLGAGPARRFFVACHGMRLVDEGGARYAELTLERADADLRRAMETLRRAGAWTPRRRDSLAMQLVHAVNYLHALGYAHRDLKPQNVLVNAAGRLKLCDFGLARETERAEYTPDTVVTLWWRAPEVLLGARRYDAARVDVWAVGVILYQLHAADGEPPWVPRNARARAPHGPRVPAQYTCVDMLFRITQDLGAAPRVDEEPDAEGHPYDAGAFARGARRAFTAARAADVAAMPPAAAALLDGALAYADARCDAAALAASPCFAGVRLCALPELA